MITAGEMAMLGLDYERKGVGRLEDVERSAASSTIGNSTMSACGAVVNRITARTSYSRQRRSVWEYPVIVRSQFTRSLGVGFLSSPVRECAGSQ